MFWSFKVFDMLKFSKLTLVVSCLLVLCCLTVTVKADDPATDKIKVLIVDGQNNHTLKKVENSLSMSRELNSLIEVMICWNSTR